MKIGTDGVLLGAWATIAQASSILDIGTGTGVLALMLAQRNTKALIDAVEIESAAYQQAVYNIEQSTWQERIKVYHQAIQSFAPNKVYDSIISNPPYFDHDQNTPIKDKARSWARSSETLRLEDLLEVVHRLLHQDGNFSLILPYQEGKQLLQQIEKYPFFAKTIVEVHPRIGKKPNRLLLELVKQPTITTQQQFAIRNQGKDYHDYTSDFEQLHQPFLLRL